MHQGPDLSCFFLPRKSLGEAAGQKGLDQKARSMETQVTEAQEASGFLNNKEEAFRAVCEKFSNVCFEIAEAGKEEQKKTTEYLEAYIEKWKEAFRGKISQMNFKIDHLTNENEFLRKQCFSFKIENEQKKGIQIYKEKSKESEKRFEELKKKLDLSEKTVEDQRKEIKIMKEIEEGLKTELDSIKKSRDHLIENEVSYSLNQILHQVDQKSKKSSLNSISLNHLQPFLLKMHESDCIETEKNQLSFPTESHSSKKPMAVQRKKAASYFSSAFSCNEILFPVAKKAQKQEKAVSLSFFKGNPKENDSEAKNKSPSLKNGLLPETPLLGRQLLFSFEKNNASGAKEKRKKESSVGRQTEKVLLRSFSPKEKQKMREKSEKMITFGEGRKDLLVFCKIRPKTKGEKEKKMKSEIWVSKDKKGLMQNACERRFDRCFGKKEPTSAVWQCLESLLEKSWKIGSSFSLIAFGELGSGKTRLLQGTHLEPGILPRAVQFCFQRKKEDPSCQVCFSANVFSQKKSPIDLLEDFRGPKNKLKGEIFSEGPEEMNGLLMHCIKKRQKELKIEKNGVTWSQTVFTFILKIKEVKFESKACDYRE